MKVKWTLEHIEKLKQEGKIRDYKINGKKDEPKKPKRAKYRNQKVEWNGMVFDSKKEYNRYRELLLLLKAGKIGQLERQVEYKLEVEGQKVTSYIADHRFIWSDTGNVQVEDVKSDATRKLPVYRLKKKLMKAVYGIEIVEL